MTDTMHHFVRGNLLSPVSEISVNARYTRYKLVDGASYRLNRTEMERLGRFMERTGFRLRLTGDLAERTGANID